MNPRGTTERGSAGRDTARSSRDRLIAAAALLFHERGYRHVSLERVLREAGVSRSNLYYHFRSKEDLAVAVIDAWLEDVSRAVLEPALATDGLTPLGRVRAVVDGLITRLDADNCRGGCPFGTLANSEAEHNDRFRQKLVETFDSFAALLEKLYADAAACGELPPAAPPPTQLAAGTLGLIQGGYLLSKTYGDITPMRLAADGWMDLLAAQCAGPGA